MGFGGYSYGGGYAREHKAEAFDRETGRRVGAVHTTDQAAHVWAQGNVTFGRSSKGVVYFHGRALFDYGPHYVAAYLMPDGKSVLINDSHVSPTTSGHVSTARYASRPRERYAVPELTALLSGDRHGSAALYPGRAEFGSVAGTAEFESAIDARLADRAHVRAFCEAHALELAPESLAYLLGLVGLARSAGKVRRDAERRRDKAKAEEQAADRKRAIATLREFATAPDVVAYIADKSGGYYHSGDESAALVSQVAKRIRSARKLAGKRSLPPRLWRETWTRLQAIQIRTNPIGQIIGGAVADVREELARRRARADRASRLGALRNALANWKAPRETQDSPDESAHEWHRLMADVRHAERKAREAGRLAQAIAALWPVAFAAPIAALYSWAEERETWAQAERESDRLLAARVAWDASEAERKAAEAAEAERLERETWEAWQRGEPVRLRGWRSREGGAAYIRATGVERDASGDIVGGELETSQGASVPLVQAVKLFRFLKLVRQRGNGWQRNGARIRVGHFEVDSIAPDGGFIAGCHSFEWRDVEELAQSLGVFELAPDESAVVKRAAA